MRLNGDTCACCECGHKCAHNQTLFVFSSQSEGRSVRHACLGMCAPVHAVSMEVHVSVYMRCTHTHVCHEKG